MNGFLKVFLICFAINAIWIIIKWLAKANKDSDKNSLSDEDDMIADKTINAKSDNDKIEKADSSTVSNISFNAKTPISIGAGQQFRLFYTLYNAVGKNFKLPEMANFDVIYGASIQKGTGKSQTGNFTYESYTYILKAKKEGVFYIPPAIIYVGNTQYKSNSIKINVERNLDEELVVMR